jgi:hypothetical protein
MCKNYPNVTVIHGNIKEIKGKGPNYRHGHGLNLAFSLSKTNRTAIVESDCVVLNRDWDRIRKPYFSKGIKKGSGINREDYYYPCFVVFYSKCMKDKFGEIDFRPGPPDSGFQISKNGKLYNDVGWRMSNYIGKKDMDLLNIMRPQRDKCRYFDKRLAYKTFEIWEKNTPIVAHFGRGSFPYRRNIVKFREKGKIIELNWIDQINLWTKIVNEEILGE